MVRTLFDVAVVIGLVTIIFFMAGCTPKPKPTLNLPGAYQFCIDNPQHEECVE